MSERYEVERRNIMAAIDRLVARDGSKPSIATLVQESGIQGRWILTHRHTDLKDQFLAGVARKWGSDAPGPSALQKRFDELQAKYTRQRLRLIELENVVGVYAAAIKELTEQRDALANGNTVTPIRRLRTPPS